MAFYSFLLVAFYSFLAFLPIRFFKKNFLFIFSLFTLAVFATFRDGQNMPDYLTYVGLYKNVTSGVINYFIEISFLFIVKISHLFSPNNYFLMFFFYAFIAIFFKLKSFFVLSLFPVFSILVYTSNFFILHEMIQIRAGVAVALLFYSLKYIIEKNFFRFTIFIFLATFFHYSSFIFFFIYFLNVSKYNRNFLFFIVPLSYLIHFFVINIDLISLASYFIPFPDIISKLVLYSSGDNDSSVNVFGIFIFTRIVIFFFFSYFSKFFLQRYQYFPMFLNLYAYGIFLYISLSSFPHISVRLGYTLLFSEIFLIPLLFLLFKNKFFSRCLIVLYSFLNLIFNILFTSYFNWVS